MRIVIDKIANWREWNVTTTIFLVVLLLSFTDRMFMKFSGHKDVYIQANHRIYQIMQDFELNYGHMVLVEWFELESFHTIPKTPNFSRNFSIISKFKRLFRTGGSQNKFGSRLRKARCTWPMYTFHCFEFWWYHVLCSKIKPVLSTLERTCLLLRDPFWLTSENSN